MVRKGDKYDNRDCGGGIVIVIVIVNSSKGVKRRRIPLCLSLVPSSSLIFPASENLISLFSLILPPESSISPPSSALLLVKSVLKWRDQPTPPTPPPCIIPYEKL